MLFLTAPLNFFAQRWGLDVLLGHRKPTLLLMSSNAPADPISLVRPTVDKVILPLLMESIEDAQGVHAISPYMGMMTFGVATAEALRFRLIEAAAESNNSLELKMDSQDWSYLVDSQSIRCHRISSPDEIPVHWDAARRNAKDHPDLFGEKVSPQEVIVVAVATPEDGFQQAFIGILEKIPGTSRGVKWARKVVVYRTDGLPPDGGIPEGPPVEPDVSPPVTLRPTGDTNQDAEAASAGFLFVC